LLTRLKKKLRVKSRIRPDLTVLSPQPQSDVIQMARNLLERAESGEAQALAIVFVSPDRGCSTAFALGSGGAHVLGFGAFDLACRLRGCE